MESVTQTLMEALALVALTAPMCLLACLGLMGLVGRPPTEQITGRMVTAGFLTSTFAALGLIPALLLSGARQAQVELGTWYAFEGHALHLTLQVDRLSVPFVVLTALLLGVVGSFSHRYLHREPSYGRFFLLLALLGSGTMLVVLAGTADMAFAGWEMVGVSSALLVGFFYERPAPVRNALWVFVIYRLCDVGLFAGIVLLHHAVGSDSFHLLGAGRSWPNGVSTAPIGQATAISILFALAAMGKSALVPFSGWLPRAMEGPTPSSAIFYGALSVHLGPYLLLRAAPLLDRAPVAATLLVVVGALTALHATLVGRVQTDIKCALAYASLTQVGVIFVEIGLGFRLLPLAHCVGHACLRSLQILRAPSMLSDVHEVEAAVGGILPRSGIVLGQLLPSTAQRWMYRWALERCYLDALLERCAVGPFREMAAAADRFERRWTDRLGGTDASAADLALQPTPGKKP